jgi:serine/threonine protein kinase
MSSEPSPLALQPGYELHWYRIERVLGQGAFGITYLAHDINLDREVAIKEYLPGQFSTRDDNLTVKPTTAEQKDDFDWGLKRFISEARTLTRFEHPNLVRVFNVFEVNGTAYMVMNYEVGKSLQQILKTRKTLREDEITRILNPLMNGLEMMHEKGFVHRDIKPGNIYIRGDGSPVLLDFGSARQTRAAAGRDGHDDPQTLTALVSPGYAPIEQYGSRSDRQGPWTDIYGLGATAYRAISGVMPVAAVDRSEAIVHDGKDPYLPLAEALKERYSAGFLAAIDHALAFRADDRPQSMEAWRGEFPVITGEAGAQPQTGKDSTESEPRTQVLENSEAETIDLSAAADEKTEPLDTASTGEADTVVLTAPAAARRKTLLAVAGGIVVIILLGVLYSGGDEPEPINEITATEAATARPLDELVMVEEPVVEPPPAPEITQEDTRKQEQIDELHRLAKADIEALRLTSPKDNNAFDKYLAILKLDENNEAAQQGIVAISDKYVTLAYGAMASGKLDHAESYLNKAAVIVPDSAKIAAASRALDDKRAAPAAAATTATAPSASESPARENGATATPAEEENQSFWNKVKKWHEENVEHGKLRTTADDDSLDARIKRDMGN